MLFVELDLLTPLTGLASFISMSIAIFLGVLVLYEGFKSKNRLVFLFFLTVLFTASPWFPSGIGYIYWIITSNEIDYQVYVLLGTLGISIAILSWLDIYLTLIHREKKSLILSSYILFSITFYLYILFFLFFAPGAPIENMIGIKITPLDISYKGYALIYIGTSIIVATLTGIDFSINSMKSDNPQVKYKGRFLLISFIIFFVCAIYDALIELSVITLILVRVLLTIGVFLYYIGFIMPKWMQHILNLES